MYKDWYNIIYEIVLAWKNTCMIYKKRISCSKLFYLVFKTVTFLKDALTHWTNQTSTYIQQKQNQIYLEVIITYWGTISRTNGWISDSKNADTLFLYG